MLWEGFILLFCSLTPLLWLRGKEVIIGNDSGAHIDALQHLINIFYSWNPTVSFGYDLSAFKGHVLVKLPETLFQLATGSLQHGEQLMFVFWFFVMGMGMYAAMRLLYDGAKFWLLRLWTSIFWMYNFFILQAWTNIDRAKFSLFAALPIVFALLIRVSQRSMSPMKAAVLSSLLLFFLNGGGAAPLYGGLFVLFGVTVITLLITQKSRQTRMALLQFVALSGMFTALTNAWWLLPLSYTTITGYSDALAGQGGTSGILNWEAMVSTNSSIGNLIRLQGIPGWQEGAFSYAQAFLTNPILIAASFVPLMLTVLLLPRWRRIPNAYQKQTVLIPLYVLIVPALIFAAGTHPPFGFIYRFFIEHVPGFAIFRSSFYKFAPALWFPIIVLSGISLQLVVSNIRQPIQKYVGGMLLACLLLYHYPYFTPNFFTFSPPFTTKVVIPEYVHQTLGDIRQTDAESRILLLPPLDTRFLSGSYSWNFWSLALLPNTGAPRSIVTNESRAPLIVADLYRAFEKDDTQKITTLTAITGITHALWQDDAVYADERKTKKDLEVYRDTLLRIPGISPVASHSAWQLYTFPHEAPPRLMNTYTSPVVFTSPNVSIEDIADIQGEPMTAVTHEPTKLARKTQVIEAICSYCDQQAREANNHLSLPTLRLYPDSPLYFFLVTPRENRTAVGLRQNRAAMIDMHTGFIGKRITELAYLTKQPEKNAGAIEETEGLLEDHLEAIADGIGELSADKQIYYANRIHDFLTFYEKAAASLVLRPDTMNTLRNRFVRTQDILSEYRFVSEGRTLRYYVTIPASQAYTISMRPISSNARLFHNGAPLSPAARVSLSEGLQKFELVLPNPIEVSEAPRLYITDTKTDIAPNPAPKVTYVRNSPTEIRGTVEASEIPFLLTFGDKFHDDWRLDLTPVSSTDHILINGYANGWVIPTGPKRTFRIFYFPQKLTDIGIIVSAIALSAMGYFLWKEKLLLDSKRTNGVSYEYE